MLMSTTRCHPNINTLNVDKKKEWHETSRDYLVMWCAVFDVILKLTTRGILQYFYDTTISVRVSAIICESIMLKTKTKVSLHLIKRIVDVPKAEDGYTSL